MSRTALTLAVVLTLSALTAGLILAGGFGVGGDDNSSDSGPLVVVTIQAGTPLSLEPTVSAPVTPSPEPTQPLVAASSTAAPVTPPPAATAVPSASATPVPTQPANLPPAPTIAQSGAIQFKPAQMVQGGVAIVYLTQPATSATARFNERVYPMLHDGQRWWAVIGVGALTQSGLHPVTVTYTPSGRTESVSVVQSITVTQRNFSLERIDLPPDTAALLAPDIVQAEIQQRANIYSGFTAQRLWSGAFIAPNAGPISDNYGIMRSYNGAPATDYHRGTDFIADTGDRVVAAASGRVAFTGQLKVRGGTVIIDHGAGVFTAYHHLSSINAVEDQLISVGETVGQVGSTGLVTGPHLHWEVIVRGVEVDGEIWLFGGEIAP